MNKPASGLNMLQNQILKVMISLLIVFIIVKGEKLPSVTLLADKYWAMKNQTIKLNCSSNIRSFGLNAEFLLYGNTYNNVGLFNNRCFRTIDARVCTPKICSCSVDGLSFMFMFDISKIPKTDNNGLLFGCQMNFRAEKFTKGLFASETFMIPVIGNVNGFQTTDVFKTQPICSCVYTNRSSKFILSERKDITNDSNDKCDCIPDVTDRQQVDLRKFQLTVITSIVASVCAMVFTVALMTVCIVMIKLLKPQNIDNDDAFNNERTYQTLSPSSNQNQQYTEVQLTFYEEAVVPQVESHHYDTPSSEADMSLLVPQINHYDVCEDL